MLWKLILLLTGIVAGFLVLGRAEYRVVPAENQKVAPYTQNEQKPVIKGISSKKLWFTPWSGRKYSYKEPISPEDLGPAVETLIDCERPADPTACIIDVNGKQSCGVLQYQWDTWNGWEKEFGIEGDPRNQLEARVMAYKALAAGYAHHWSCAKKTGLLE